VTYLKKIEKDKLLHPVLVKGMDLTHRKLVERGAPFKTYSGNRTFVEQNKLYRKGRDAISLQVVNKKKVITNARGGQSMHNYACAVDSAPLNLQTPENWDVHWPKLDTVEGRVWYLMEECLHEALEELEGQLSGETLEWGGRWNFTDLPHIQIKTSLRELRAGRYPRTDDIEWLVNAHTTFLFDTPWMTRRVQYLLYMQSYTPGVIDGIIGPRTIDALWDFQNDKGIKQPNTSDHDKTFDKPTVERLVRIHQGAISLRVDEPDDLLDIA